MSVTKDGDTGRWMSQIRVTDWTGKTIHKKKRGFATKKEALQWERDFISQSTGSLGMTFGDFIALYVKDMEHLNCTPKVGQESQRKGCRNLWEKNCSVRN